jgi:hypothetical protein
MDLTILSARNLVCHPCPSHLPESLKRPQLTFHPPPESTCTLCEYFSNCFPTIAICGEKSSCQGVDYIAGWRMTRPD